MPDYLPRTDGDLLLWQRKFVTQLNLLAADLGLLPADVAGFAAAQSEWEDAYFASDAAAQAYRTSVELKDEKRSIFVEMIRAIVRRLQASPQVSDDERRALGITVKEDGRSMATATAVNATRPMCVVDTSVRWRHEIKFFDESTPKSRAKPKGVSGCEIWAKVGGEEPKNAGECSFVAFDTASPYIVQYDEGEDGGKKVYYLLRWVNSHGEKGPWSETVAATIVG